MSKKILLVGEPLVLLLATKSGSLPDVLGYDVGIAGAEFNVSVGMKRLGHDVSYMTKLGDDPFGKLLVNLIKEKDIDTSLISHSPKKSTGMMLKSLVDSGEDPEIYYYRKESAASTLSTKDINEIDFSKYSNLHLTGIFPALSDSSKAAAFSLLINAHKRGLTISLDPNLRPQLWSNKYEMINVINNLASLSDIFLPGINEGKILTGYDAPEDIAKFYLDIGCKIVVVKLGGKGCYVADGHNDFFVKGYYIEKIIDTVGAGDGFATGFISALMENLSPLEAAKRANAIGAIQLMHRGDNDGLPTKEELDKFMNK